MNQPFAAAAPSNESWYAIQTKVRQESRAAANLRMFAVETFLPQIRGRAKNHDRGRAERVEPLFPGYLFVRCNVPAVAHRISYTRGVGRMLGNQSGPTPIADEVIDALRSRVAEDGFVRLEPECFRAGDPVRITSGPLGDFVGVFESRLSSSERVAILIRTVTTQVRVIVERDVLERAS